MNSQWYGSHILFRWSVSLWCIFLESFPSVANEHTENSRAGHVIKKVLMKLTRWTWTSLLQYLSAQDKVSDFQVLENENHQHKCKCTRPTSIPIETLLFELLKRQRKLERKILSKPIFVIHTLQASWHVKHVSAKWDQWHERSDWKAHNEERHS